MDRRSLNTHHLPSFVNMQSQDYFINSSNNDNNPPTKLHFWEPHTSSIDFCETNYLHSPYIVEPHNVVSSLWGLSAIGFIGIYFGNPTNELRFKIAYGILLLIGLGSAALHGTLHWIFQSSDELPMIYLVLSVVYSLFISCLFIIDLSFILISKRT